MAITPPAAQQMIDAVTWGKPITDELNRLSPMVDGATRLGFTRTGVSFTSATANSYVPLATVRESAGAAFTPDGTNTQFTSPAAGLFLLAANIFAGANALPSGVWAGIHVDGITKTRTYVISSSNVAYGTLSPLCVAQLAIGSKVGFVVAGAALTWLPVSWPGASTDAAAPMFSCWRVSA
jgi:hypothetical protein